MNGQPMVPVFIKDATFEPPAADAYFLLAADGLYLVRKTLFFTACVRTEGGVPGLRAQTPSLDLKLPRMPAMLLERAVGFFREVHVRWGGEAILIMFYAPPAGDRPARFALEAPPQIIRGRFVHGRFCADLALDYGACTRPGADFVKLGSLHSHGTAGPTHSAIDKHDELFESGLHVTVGYVDSRRPEFAAAFVVGRTRFTVPAADVLSPFRAARRPPPEWMTQVTVAWDAWGGFRNSDDTFDVCGGSSDGRHANRQLGGPAARKDQNHGKYGSIR